MSRPSDGWHLGGLTRRELIVLELVAEGFTNREIAVRLFLSDRTVQKHLDHLYYKLGVHTRTAAARIRNQWLSLPLGEPWRVSLPQRFLLTPMRGEVCGSLRDR